MELISTSGNECKFSQCRRFRYTLLHRWGPGEPLVWIGLNPSTADEQQLDPTLRKIREFSRRAGHNAFLMLNLYAYRSTDPKGLNVYVGCPFDLDQRDNWPVIEEETRGRRVVCAWGQPGPIPRAKDLAVLIARNASEILCLGVNSSGARAGCPKHPLYLPYETTLVPFNPPPTPPGALDATSQTR